MIKLPSIQFRRFVEIRPKVPQTFMGEYNLPGAKVSSLSHFEELKKLFENADQPSGHLCRIGSGGLGNVFSWPNRSDGRRVAVKLLHLPQKSFDYGISANNDTMVQLSRQNDYPESLCKIYGVHTLESGIAIFMEEIEGIPASRGCDDRIALDLSHLVNGRNEGYNFDIDPRNLSVAKDIFSQLIDGISYLYSRGLRLNEVKPQNILLRGVNDGHVKIALCDFDYMYGVDAAFDLALLNLLEEASYINGGDTGTIIPIPAIFRPPELKGRMLPDERYMIWMIGATIHSFCDTRTPQGDLERNFEGSYQSYTPWEDLTPLSKIGWMATELDPKARPTIEELKGIIAKL